MFNFFFAPIKRPIFELAHFFDLKNESFLSVFFFDLTSKPNHVNSALFDYFLQKWHVSDKNIKKTHDDP